MIEPEGIEPPPGSEESPPRESDTDFSTPPLPPGTALDNTPSDAPGTANEPTAISITEPTSEPPPNEPPPGNSPTEAVTDPGVIEPEGIEPPPGSEESPPRE
ncbi:hypothetical protein ACH0BZ_06870, partial [Dietzia sp. 179-F 9C3 NHS]